LAAPQNQMHIACSAAALHYPGMQFFIRAAGVPRKLGVFPGTFNPPTLAHLALAEAAGPFIDELVFVVPKSLPHKSFDGASFEQRIEMLRDIVGDNPRTSIAATEGGLFVEIARECKESYPGAPALLFLCGRDAAERIIEWDYGHPGAVPHMLDELELLVASRGGSYEPPPAIAERVHALPLSEEYGDISATEVRERIRKGLSWEHLIPRAIAAQVKAIYS